MREFGFVHAGEVGAGHFAKMVHNGIKYAIMRPTPKAGSLRERAHIAGGELAVTRTHDRFSLEAWFPWPN